jgi:hypothetical protein
MREVRIMVGVKQSTQSAAVRKRKTVGKKATRPTTGEVVMKGGTPAKKSAAMKRRNGVVTPDERHRMIAETAFLKAEQRGFQGCDPVEDWLQAEQEVDRALSP